MRFVLLALVLVVAGCASSGVMVSSDALGALKVGETTQSQAVASLGKPTSLTTSSDGSALINYSHAKYTGGALVMHSVTLRFASDGKLAEVTRYESDTSPK